MRSCCAGPRAAGAQVGTSYGEAADGDPFLKVPLDRLVVEPGDEDGRQLVEGALRLTADVERAELVCPLAPPNE